MAFKANRFNQYDLGILPIRGSIRFLVVIGHPGERTKRIIEDHGALPVPRDSEYGALYSNSGSWLMTHTNLHLNLRNAITRGTSVVVDIPEVCLPLVQRLLIDSAASLNEE